MISDKIKKLQNVHHKVKERWEDHWNNGWFCNLHDRSW